MKLNISQAINRSGVARATFYKMMNEGQISTSTDGRGRKVVDTSELIRVFGELKKEPEGNSKNVQLNSSTATELDMLRQRIEFIEQQLKDKTVQLEETKERESKANERVDQLMRLLENNPSNASTGHRPGQSPEQSTPEPTSAPETGLRGLLKRVLG